MLILTINVDPCYWLMWHGTEINMIFTCMEITRDQSILFATKTPRCFPHPWIFKWKIPTLKSLLSTNIKHWSWLNIANCKEIVFIIIAKVARNEATDQMKSTFSLYFTAIKKKLMYEYFANLTMSDISKGSIFC